MSEKQHAIPKHALQLVFSRKPERRQNETQRNIEPIEIMLRATAVEFTHNHTYVHNTRTGCMATVYWCIYTPKS